VQHAALQTVQETHPAVWHGLKGWRQKVAILIFRQTAKHISDKRDTGAQHFNFVPSFFTNTVIFNNKFHFASSKIICRHFLSRKAKI